MERRTILKLVAAGVLPGAGGLVQIGCSVDGYRPEFFSVSEFRALDDLAEVILPSDERSPGARAAKVARYIDILVADSGSDVRERWRSGLAAVASLARERFDRDFPACDAAQQDEIVGGLAGSEESPESAAERFFVTLKRAAIEGYYTSQVGIHEEFGYRGNTAVDQFPGCTHETHG